jgi:hypothetical protein
VVCQYRQREHPTPVRERHPGFHNLFRHPSLFEYLCKKNAVNHNPIKGVKRPRVAPPSSRLSAAEMGDQIVNTLEQRLAADAGTAQRTRRRRPQAAIVPHFRPATGFVQADPRILQQCSIAYFL